MAGWTVPVELDQALPRIVKRRSVFTILVISQVLSFIVFIGFIGATTGADFYKRQVLRERGVQAVGAVTNLYTTSGKQTSYNVTYVYPVDPKPAFTATDELDPLNFNQLHVGDAVPIAYDPTYPSRSLLNFDNIVFAGDNLHMLTIPVIIVPLALLGMLFVVLTFVRDYRRQKRLLQWGKTAVAAITSDTEYNAGKAGRKAAVSYTFTDESGQIVQGKRRGLPVKDRRQDAMYKEMFEDPTVLYDPEDSSKNMLYPLALVDCPPKAQPSVFSAP